MKKLILVFFLVFAKFQVHAACAGLAINTDTMPFDAMLMSVDAQRGETALSFLNRRLLVNYRHLFAASTLHALENTSRVHQGLVLDNRSVRSDYILVIDYTLAADAARMFAIRRESVSGRDFMTVRQYHVAHGGGANFRTNTDMWMRRPSATSGSGLSSFGAYLTAEYYVGGVGHAIRLDGLDPENASGLGRAGHSSARARFVVLHEDCVKMHPTVEGVPFLQHTRGCPAVSRTARLEMFPIIRGTQTPTLLYAHWSLADLRANMAAAGINLPAQ